MSVKVFNNKKQKWLSEIKENILSGNLEAVFLKKESNAYPFNNYSEANEWVDKLKNYKADEWSFFEQDS